MDIGELQYGRFKKLIRKLPSEEVQYFFDFLNLLQLYRNFSEIRPFFTGVPVDNPEVWLGTVLCDRKLQRKLIEQLSGNESYRQFASTLMRVKQFKTYIDPICLMPVESRERAILVVQHEHWLRKLISNLQRLGIDNLSAFEKRIRAVIGFRGEFEDSLFEGKLPIGVRRHIDQIQAIRFYPTGKKKGPDYELGFGQQTIFVEFTRFREDEDLFKSLQIKEDQTELSEIPWGYEQIWNKITKKLDQLVKGEINIIVLYSAHDAREGLDFRIVVSKYLADPANAYLLKHLSGVLFTDKWSTPPEFWVNGRAERVFPSGLIELFRTAIYDFKAVALE